MGQTVIIDRRVPTREEEIRMSPTPAVLGAIAGWTKEKYGD